MDTSANSEQPDDAPERVFFEPLKEDRGTYFVEYRPPATDSRLATLAVCCIEPLEPEALARVMEAELTTWTKRYAVPVMVTAFDTADRVIVLGGVRPCDHLVGWLDPDGHARSMHWRLLANSELPNGPLTASRLIESYPDLPYETLRDKRLKTDKQARVRRLAVGILIVWLVVIPAAIAILGWANPWVGGVSTAYSLWQAYQQWLKVTGRRKKSARERQRENEETLMHHHHYHCQQNPQAFARLKVENFDRWQREAFQKEVAELREKALPEQRPEGSP